MTGDSYVDGIIDNIIDNEILGDVTKCANDIRDMQVRDMMSRHKSKSTEEVVRDVEIRVLGNQEKHAERSEQEKDRPESFEERYRLRREAFRNKRRGSIDL